MQTDAMKVQATYATGDIWQAAYLMVMNVPLERTVIDSLNRTRWIFTNDGDKAWKEGLEFREGYAVAPVFEVRKYYRLLSKLAQDARAGRVNDDNNLDN